MYYENLMLKQIFFFCKCTYNVYACNILNREFYITFFNIKNDLYEFVLGSFETNL